MKTISIGKQSFSSIREKSNFYIDKTDFIKEWWESEDAVTLITRPRRFGKTQAALKQIQDKQYDMELLAEGFSKEQIRHYGFAFRGKEVLIG